MKTKEFLKGILAGAAIGSAVGVLFAPKSGKETRKDISRAYKKVSADLSHRVKDIQDITREKYHEMVDKAVKEYRKVEDMTKEQVDSLTTALKEKWDQKKDEVDSNTSAKISMRK